MTIIIESFRDVAHADGAGTVRFSIPEVRDNLAGDGVIVTRTVRVPVVDGALTTPELEPGHATVDISVGGWKETRDVVIPDEGTHRLRDLIGAFTPQPPPVVSEAWSAAKEAAKDRGAAQTARSEAEGFADTAGKAATAAAGSQRNAATAEAEAREHSRTATGKADDAIDAATRAGRSADTASASEREAAQSAEAADRSAGDAKDYRDAAQRSAEAAAQSESAAAGSAEATTKSALAATTAATTAAGSASEANAARDETVVPITPFYDWASGANFASNPTLLSKPTWLKRRLTGSGAAAFVPGTAGRTYTVALEVLQDSVGGRTLAFSNVRWQWGLVPTVTPTANATDIYLFTWTGAYWIGSVLAQGIS